MGFVSRLDVPLTTRQLVDQADPADVAAIRDFAQAHAFLTDALGDPAVLEAAQGDGDCWSRLRTYAVVAARLRCSAELFASPLATPAVFVHRLRREGPKVAVLEEAARRCMDKFNRALGAAKARRGNKRRRSSMKGGFAGKKRIRVQGGAAAVIDAAMTAASAGAATVAAAGPPSAVAGAASAISAPAGSADTATVSKLVLPEVWPPALAGPLLPFAAIK